MPPFFVSAHGGTQQRHISIASASLASVARLLSESSNAIGRQAIH